MYLLSGCYACRLPDASVDTPTPVPYAECDPVTCVGVRSPEKWVGTKGSSLIIRQAVNTIVARGVTGSTRGEQNSSHSNPSTMLC